MSSVVSDREKLMAHVLFEIRLRLAIHVGSTSDSPAEVRHAAHLVYAVHNIALDAVEGRASDLSTPIGMLQLADSMLGQDFCSRVLAQDQSLGRLVAAQA